MLPVLPALLALLLKTLEPPPLLNGPAPAARAAGSPSAAAKNAGVKEKELTEAFLKTAAGSREALQAARGEGSPARPESGTLPPGTQDTTALLPLPLKAPHFPEASFYLVINREEAKKSEREKDALTLLLVLKTFRLGVLRLLFVHRRDILHLNMMTQTREVQKYLEKNCPELEAELVRAGCPNVVLKTILLSGDTGTENFSSSPGLKAPEPFFDLYI